MVFLFLFIQLNLLNRQEENPFRLPGDIRPVHYNISLIPILDGDNFTTLGQIEITLDCIRDTTQIKLNSVDIEVDEGSILVIYIHNLYITLC